MMFLREFSVAHLSHVIKGNLLFNFKYVLQKQYFALIGLGIL